MTVEYQNPLHAAPRIPWRERINLRLVIFIAIVGILVLYPVYVAIDLKLSGGIKQAGDGYLAVNLKAMSTFDFDQVNGKLEEIPQRYRELDGKKVVLKGEMWSPTGAGEEVEGFALVYSIAKCCVTGTPLVQHLVISKPMEGKRIHYYTGQVEARGVLRVNVKKDGGRIASIYHLDVESVEPVH